MTWQNYSDSNPIVRILQNIVSRIVVHHWTETKDRIDMMEFCINVYERFLEWMQNTDVRKNCKNRWRSNGVIRNNFTTSQLEIQ